MHNHQRHLFAITHRAIGRTRWQMTASNILGHLPREQPANLFGDGQVQHDSALIRRIAPHENLIGSVFQASDIFVVRFLRTLDGGDAVDFGVADWVTEAMTNLSDDEDAE
jgi:hypothetical protein